LAYKNREMVKIAYYYYQQDLTQAQIAKKMNMSRQRVNRVLKKAVEENIIEIKIVDIDKYNVELENHLEEKYNLDQAVVISPLDDNSIISSLGIAGAEFLEDTLSKGDSIGVTWGRTLSEVAKRLQSNSKLKTPVTQLIGGLNIAFTDLQADEITRTMAYKLGGEAHILYAPAIVENKEIKDAIMSDNQLKQTFQNMDKCNIMILGIGDLHESTILHRDKDLNNEYKNHLFPKKAVGDIGFRWFNKYGEPVEQDYDDRTIGYDILRKESKALKVGIAGGKKKHDAILGALNGGFLDVLITDNSTAKTLIKS